MNIFISHTSKNKELAFEPLYRALSAEGHSVFSPYKDILPGTAWADELKENVRRADLLIAIISEDFRRSDWCQAELSAAVFNHIGKAILPVLVGDAFAPSYIKEIQLLKVRDFKEVPDRVVEYVRQLVKNKAPEKPKPKPKIDANDYTSDDIIRALREAYFQGELTLVCGAGVSIGSNLPSWFSLLVGLAKTCFPESDVSDIFDRFPNSSSNLILCKYFKALLPDTFEIEVRKQLYKNYQPSNLNTPLLSAIYRLAMPSRKHEPLDSILTYNYDDLIERKLKQGDIPYDSIWKEQQLPESDSLHIFHVHGYLPQTENPDEKPDEPNLVLAEDAYHSQFYDTYSWSNLIQLNTFTAKTCLFVGSSLSDPNLRRLLDVAYRKHQKQKHFAILKHPQDELAAAFLELDANSLGLNVCWCKEYEDIPAILDRISAKA